MIRSPRRPLDARHIVESVVSDSEFKERRQDGTPPREAFALTAMTLVEIDTTPEGNRTRCADQLHVAATASQYINSKITLDQSGYSSRHARDIKREGIVTFNHALQHLIDGDPDADFDEVKGFLSNIYRSLHRGSSSEHYAYANRCFFEALKGMANELMGQQMAGHLGYPVEPASEEDDLLGIDCYFGMEGAWQPVDLKTSSHFANIARANDHNGNKLILATNLPNSVVTSGFRLDAEAVQRYAEPFAQEMSREWSRVQRLRRYQGKR